MGFIIIYVTYRTLKDARLVSLHLLERKLIAGSNIFPISSFFWWQGNVTEDGEYVSLFMTRKENWSLVCAEIRKMHPYDIPAMIRFDVSANPDLESWIARDSHQEP